MAYASQAGFARTNPDSPQAHAICDRCGFRFNHVNLKWQYDWRGASLQNTRILVCDSCNDRPQTQLKAIIVPSDPDVVPNARTPGYEAAEQGSATGLPYGAPDGLVQGAVMPLNNGVRYGLLLPILSVTGNGTTKVTVTCAAPHNLSTNSQISVQGLSNPNADGFYAVTVTTGTAFTYTTYANVPSGALATQTTRIVTALVGLPYNQTGFTPLPQPE
jgi:hypothetical protein